MKGGVGQLKGITTHEDSVVWAVHCTILDTNPIWSLHISMFKMRIFLEECSKRSRQEANFSNSHKVSSGLEWG